MRAGLYDDLAPGSTGIDNLVDHVLAQAERMGLPVEMPESHRTLARLRRPRLALQ